MKISLYENNRGYNQKNMVSHGKTKRIKHASLP